MIILLYRLYVDFVKIWIPINGTQQCGIRSPKINRNSAVDRLLTGPQDLGRHSFRGFDTHKNFTDHLYTPLVTHGIHTFRDDEELEN